MNMDVNLRRLPRATKKLTRMPSRPYRFVVVSATGGQPSYLFKAIAEQNKLQHNKSYILLW